MSVELIVEVLKHAPAELNPTERLTLVAIAESCRTDTRMTYYRDGWDAAELARRVGVTAESLTKVFRSLAAKGCEVRVAHAMKNGKPVFAFKGKQTTFKLPRFAPQRSDEDRTMDPQRVDESPGFSEGGEVKGWTSVRQSLDESPAFGAQSLDESPPLLLKDLPSKNPSSLSRADQTSAPTAAVPAQRIERENEGISQNQDQPLTPVQKLIAKHGATTEQIGYVEAIIDMNHNVQSAGFYFAADRNGSLAALVGDALAAYDQNPNVTAARCTICNGEGETGDYLNRRPCDCLWFTDPDRIRPWWVNQLDQMPPCPDGVNGGDIEAPNGWRYCSLCRGGPGWKAKNQPRTEDRRDFKPSAAASRARQGLAVADELDRKYGDGAYAREIRSPADQRVADGQVLYEKYKRQEQRRPGQHIPYRDPPAEAYRNSKI